MRHVWTFLTDATEATEAAQAAETNSLQSMSEMLNVLLLVMLLGFGAYGIYTYIRLRRTYEMFPNKFMYPGNCKPEECLDPDGFLDYIMPRVLILSVLMLVCGLAYGVYYVMKLDLFWVDIASMVVPVAILIWYAVAQRKASKLYW